ncbi:hypothetical protein VCSRO104_3628 [Vibrio cholerae]|uniref:hypothetical protein n=1 Tax=Vibrio cholerae TaxID=666 RepID=UPI000E0A680D|nr:hypothetical protein [Vibrio cholerae]EKF9799688.1 hypothetical protein [Vibrio cholerae]TXY35553.1 hypothetical protein FXE83_05895 [Vibrio cholerae]GHW87371.1 hypothetical protein VCSRO104_3628 [Vibrio cholerae]
MIKANVIMGANVRPIVELSEQTKASVAAHLVNCAKTGDNTGIAFGLFDKFLAVTPRQAATVAAFLLQDPVSLLQYIDEHGETIH